MRAVCLPVTIDVDLNDVARSDGMLFVRNGVGLAGRGVAARVPFTEAQSVLSAIECDNQVGGPGTGVVALGCLPFEGLDVAGTSSALSELVIPEVTIGKDAAGRCWMTVVGDADPAEAFDFAPVRTTAASYFVRPVEDDSVYCAAVVQARDAVRSGQADKLVMAREIVVECDRAIDIHAVLRRLKASFGSSYRYSFDGFVGASPELLVAREGDTVRSLPLAGTKPRTGDPEADARIAAQLVASMKNQIEHRVVIDVVHDTLLPWCSYLDWEPEPSVLAVANVQHLATAIEGRLSSPAPSVLDLAAALCPTPALGGHPRDVAFTLVRQIEGRERGRYGGAVGWVDALGNGTWAVAIRCAQFADDRQSAVLTAGCGIVADSDPDDELAETQAKFQAMLAAIVRP